MRGASPRRDPGRSGAGPAGPQAPFSTGTRLPGPVAMVLQKAVKSYPMVKWFLVVSAVLVVLGLMMSKVLSDPDNADTSTLLLFLAGAAVLPFLAMLFPRRNVVAMELP